MALSPGGGGMGLRGRPLRAATGMRRAALQRDRTERAWRACACCASRGRATAVSLVAAAAASGKDAHGTTGWSTAYSGRSRSRSSPKARKPRRHATRNPTRTSVSISAAYDGDHLVHGLVTPSNELQPTPGPASRPSVASLAKMYPARFPTATHPQFPLATLSACTDSRMAALRRHSHA